MSVAACTFLVSFSSFSLFLPLENGENINFFIHTYTRQGLCVALVKILKTSISNTAGRKLKSECILEWPAARW